MSHLPDFLQKKDRVTITPPILLEYHTTSKQLKDCSPKTLVGARSNLGRFIHFLQSRGHSLKLADFSLQDACAYVAYLQGKGNNVKERDRETVRKIPEFLAKVGLEIQRKEVGHGP